MSGTDTDDGNVIIAASLTLAEISVEELPTGKEKLVVLPGADDDNVISFDQQIVIARHALEKFPPEMVWGEAIAQLRARHCRGRQRDFNIVDGIINESREANRDNDLTSGQEELVATVMKALSGEEDHWDPEIRAKLAKANPQVKQAFLLKFTSADTQGQLSAAMNRFSAVFGRPKPRDPLADAGGLGEGDPSLADAY
jgi:hypothetical protein